MSWTTARCGTTAPIHILSAPPTVLWCKFPVPESSGRFARRSNPSPGNHLWGGNHAALFLLGFRGDYSSAFEVFGSGPERCGGRRFEMCCRQKVVIPMWWRWLRVLASRRRRFLAPHRVRASGACWLHQAAVPLGGGLVYSQL